MEKYSVTFLHNNKEINLNLIFNKYVLLKIESNSFLVKDYKFLYFKEFSNICLEKFNNYFSIKNFNFSNDSFHLIDSFKFYEKFKFFFDNPFGAGNNYGETSEEMFCLTRFYLKNNRNYHVKTQKNKENWISFLNEYYSNFIELHEIKAFVTKIQNIMFYDIKNDQKGSRSGLSLKQIENKGNSWIQRKKNNNTALTILEKEFKEEKKYSYVLKINYEKKLIDINIHLNNKGLVTELIIDEKIIQSLNINDLINNSYIWFEELEIFNNLKFNKVLNFNKEIKINNSKYENAEITKILDIADFFSTFPNIQEFWMNCLSEETKKKTFEKLSKENDNEIYKKILRNQFILKVNKMLKNYFNNQYFNYIEGDDFHIPEKAHIISFSDCLKDLNYEMSINPENCLMLSPNLHTLFDNKMIYFDTEDGYKIKSLNKDTNYIEELNWRIKPIVIKKIPTIKKLLQKINIIKEFKN